MSRKSRRRQKGDPDTVCVRVMAEYSSTGLWLIRQTGLFRHCEISGESLGIPTELIAQFTAWSEKYYQRLEPVTFDLDAFNCTGRELARELKEHLGPESHVEFVPEAEDGGLGKPEIML